jgi:hypothetical protein
MRFLQPAQGELPVDDGPGCDSAWNTLADDVVIVRRMACTSPCRTSRQHDSVGMHPESTGDLGSEAEATRQGMLCLPDA